MIKESLIALIFLGVTFALVGPLTTDTKIKGTMVVAVVLKDGNNIEKIFSQFTISDICLDTVATSTPCTTEPQINYNGFVTKVFIFIPIMNVTKDLYHKLSTFPLAGMLEYGMEVKDINATIAKTLSEQGYNKYLVVYEE